MLWKNYWNISPNVSTLGGVRNVFFFSGLVPVGFFEKPAGSVRNWLQERIYGKAAVRFGNRNEPEKHFQRISFMQLRQYRLTWCCWYSGCPLQMLKYCQYKGRLQLRSNNYKLVTILREVDYIGYKFNRAGLYWVGYATVWGINELTSLTFVWRISMTIVAISKQTKLTLTNYAINLLLQSDWWAYWGNVA